MINKTVLAIGAHYDDCPFGVPGILLQALRRHCRVVILNIIGDYSAWAPVKGRDRQLREISVQLARQRGMEMLFLDYASMRFEVNDATKRAVAEVVADVKPDIGLMLWDHDRHPDHEVAAAISKLALRQPGTILGRGGIYPPRGGSMLMTTALATPSASSPTPTWTFPASGPKRCNGWAN